MSIRLTPEARAALVSPSSKPRCARWVATREEEQAVSRPMQGPAGASTYVSSAA